MCSFGSDSDILFVGLAVLVVFGLCCVELRWHVWGVVLLIWHQVNMISSKYFAIYFYIIEPVSATLYDATSPPLLSFR